ncbi:MAG: DUF411 domain-containing protein [Mariprofundus sp.]|nr:DUF411 domain-containing protein [Mariprofundus sp.]
MTTKRVTTKQIGVLLLTGLMLAACDSSTSTAETSAPAQQVVTSASAAKTTGTEVVMYKSPGCECCSKWADHLKGAGFTVIEHKRDDMDAIKAGHGVTKKLASCHTAIVDGYVIEGHVPAADVERLLNEHPANVVGLTAPGMPMKSPGMQTVGQQPKGYDVLAFNKDGTTTVFHRY